MENDFMMASEEQKLRTRERIKAVLTARGYKASDFEVSTVECCGDAIAALSVGIAAYRKMLETSAAQLVNQVAILRLMLKGLLTEAEIDTVLAEAGIIEKGKPAVVAGTQLVQ